jgi:RsmE family RNA methyltransferase
MTLTHVVPEIKLMNLILLFPSDIVSFNTVSLTGRRLKHVLEILKPKENDVLTVGLEGGNIGTGRVVAIDARALTMEISLDDAPPPKLSVILCVALMRPIVLKRVLLTAASMGVEEIVLFHSRQVEKSFWQSTSLGEDELREQLVLGLEQAKDTVLPKVSFQKRFKPFVEDVLPGLLKGRTGIVADPSGIVIPRPKAEGSQRPSVVIIGPEGGFIPYEVEKFQEAGCQVVGLGKRILKVETAIVTLLAKLF